MEPSDVGTPLADRSRHGLFRYLTADESADYLAIMDLSATLLTDLSAAARGLSALAPPASSTAR